MLYLSQSLVRCALQNVIEIDKKYFGTVMAHPASHSNTSPHNTCYPIVTFASSFEHNLGTLRCVCGLLYFVNICEGCFFFSRVDSTFSLGLAVLVRSAKILSCRTYTEDLRSVCWSDLGTSALASPPSDLIFALASSIWAVWRIRQMCSLIGHSISNKQIVRTFLFYPLLFA